MKRAMLLLGALVLFIAAVLGLFFADSSGPRRPALAPDGAPPVDHIDDESRDALRDILREEDGG